MHAQCEEDSLQRLLLVPLHEEGGALLGEQPPVPHDAHSVRVPGLLDIVRRDDDAHA